MPMDSASDLGEDAGNSGTAALQEREAAIKQVVGMLHVLGSTTPWEAL